MEKYIVKLTLDERNNLVNLTRTGKHAASKIMHARILLEVDEGEHADSADKATDKGVAARLHVNESSVKRVRKRFVFEGLESALSRKPHSRTRPRIIQGEEEAHLIAICCSPAPEGRTRWTLKLLSERLVEMEIVESVSAPTIGRVLKKMN